MSVIEETLKREQGFVAYLTAGDGGLSRSKEALLALVRGGVNILEVGVPFSDPVADGPVIQAAALRSLSGGTDLQAVLRLVSDLKQEVDVPIILFTYYNPLFNAGESIYQQAKAAGVDAILVVDLPIEESEQYCGCCEEAGLDPIFLISPSTPVDRIKRIAQKSRGMLYYVTRSGTTGVRQTIPPDLQERLTSIKSITQLPVVAGFGISNQEMAAAMLQYADGFVIGSLFVKAVSRGDTAEQITALAKSIDPR